eukprot:TRINITY_DN2313_c0_g1_i1.p1 TRINITY_DN2313_c0_g1~~TRINITY_DN2313_c0_g1_i1.p1  ORF type:complete len:211 (-),score=-11.65 TRINITY_DN2313_c0_g1_i1:222-854(-)
MYLDKTEGQNIKIIAQKYSILDIIIVRQRFIIPINSINSIVLHVNISDISRVVYVCFQAKLCTLVQVVKYFLKKVQFLQSDIPGSSHVFQLLGRLYMDLPTAKNFVVDNLSSKITVICSVICSVSCLLLECIQNFFLQQFEIGAKIIGVGIFTYLFGCSYCSIWIYESWYTYYGCFVGNTVSLYRYLFVYHFVLHYLLVQYFYSFDGWRC